MITEQNSTLTCIKFDLTVRPTGYLLVITPLSRRLHTPRRIFSL